MGPPPKFHDPRGILPPDGVGRYEDQPTINVHTDDQLVDQAGWRLHLGTWDEARYPRVHIDLAAGPHLIDDALGVGPRDRLQIINPPAWLPPGLIDLFAEGYTETIGVYDWDITLNCSPAGPYIVGVLDDHVLGRADTDGSQLATGIDADDTTLSVSVTAGPLWTVDDNQFPFNVLIGGEEITITDITGSSSPQTFTAIRAVNGITKSHLAGAAVRLAQPMVLGL